MKVGDIMIRVLHVYPSMNNAGTEMVMMNWYRNIDKSKIQFDFLVQDSGELDEEIKSMGGRVYCIPKYSTKQYIKDLSEFFKKNNHYKILHTHTHADMGLVLNVAKKSNIICRIAHSHNSRSDIRGVLKLIKKVKSLPIKINATHFFACSEEAGEWLFPFKNINVNIIKNGIDLEKFKYSDQFRYEVRKELNIKSDDKVICHVGRFAKEKNHELIIDICNEIIKNDKRVKVILVGTGPLEQYIKDKVIKLDISENVLFLGNRNDVNKIMCASDLFLFPSIHEGLGIVLIEAQMNGLPCIVSERVPTEADMKINLYNKCGLDENVTKWTKLIEDILDDDISRNISKKSLQNKGYDIKEVSNRIYKWYKNIIVQ